MIIRIPTTFLVDHDERALPTPAVLRATRAHAWIDTADPAFAELRADAEFYGGACPGTDDARMTRAARALLDAIDRGEALARVAARKVKREGQRRHERIARALTVPPRGAR